MAVRMSFGAPLGLLALLAAPVLVGLYFLRRRQPPRVVSALFLWASPDQRAEAGPRLERFSRETSLALEVAAVLAATAFLADLRLGGAAAEPHTVVVLDGSLSMSARPRGAPSIAEAALSRLDALVRADGGRVTVVESGLRPRVALGPAAPRERLKDLAYAPTGPSHDLAPALNLARELAGPRARIRLITDAPVEPAPEGVEVLALGRPLENDAFVAAARADRGGKAVVALRVAHFGAARAQVPVALRAEDGKALATETLTLEPGEEKALRFELSHAGPVLASLPEDPLPADGALRLVPQPPTPLKVALLLGEGPAAESVRRFLEIDGAASVASPGDLTFALPGAGRPAPWTVVLGTRGEPRAYVGPYFADRRHALLDAVPLEGLLWTAGEPVSGAPLLTSGPAILVSEEPGPVFRVNADLARSNLHRTAAWPVLLSNLFALRRETMAGFARHNLALDEEPIANVDAAAAWSLEGPRGTLPLRGAGALRLPAPGVPGRYRLLADGARADELEVLPVDRRESDLRGRGPGRAPSGIAVGRVGGERPRSAWPLLLLAALLCADWVVTARVSGARAPGRRAGA